MTTTEKNSVARVACVALDAIVRSGTPVNELRDDTVNVLLSTNPVGPSGSMRTSVGLNA